MEHYVTLFNRSFLPQGLALHASMERNLYRYILWVVCVDDQTHDVLSRINLANVRLIKLSEVETTELLSVRSSRTVAEYCWTLTPFAPKFVFNADASVSRVTYLDADLWFMKNPKSIFDEFVNSGKSVMLTEHAFASEYDQSTRAGKYCVQFMPFMRNNSEPVREWWEERCIEWCFNRVEDGKFGDQKYLDDWLERFPSMVHVLRNLRYALAPWNAQRFDYKEAIFFHFHGLRIFKKDVLKLGDYYLSETILQFVYKPYALDLRNAIDKLKLVNHELVYQVNTGEKTKALFNKLGQLIGLRKKNLSSKHLKF